MKDSEEKKRNKGLKEESGADVNFVHVKFVNIVIFIFNL